MGKVTSRHLILAAVILISIIGGLIAVYTTANGPWGYTDPVVYISTARNLDLGHGLVYYEADATFRSITIEPPFYPIMLSAIGLLPVNMVAAARWLNIFAFAACIFIAGWIFYRYTRTPGMGVIASALMCAFPYMVWMFSSAYSEPLFILTFMCAGWGLLAYFHHENTGLLVLGAILAGLVPLTRYAGVAMVLAGGICLLVFIPGRFGKRVWNTILYLAIASLPIAAWLIWIYFATAHSVGGRALGLDLHGLAAQFQAFRGIFMDTIWKWVPFQSNNMLLRYRLRFILMGVGLLVVLVLIGLAFRRLRKSGQEVRDSGLQIFGYFGLSAGLFVAVLIGTYLFTQPTIDVDNRMLLPLYVGSVMAIYAAFAFWGAAWLKGRLRSLYILPLALAALCVIWYYPMTRQQVDFYHAGDGLTAYHWNEAAIIQAVRGLPADQPVISNDWELIQLWTGRPVYGFWNTFPLEPSLQTSSYGSLPADPVQSVFCQQSAALVVFADFPSQFQDKMSTVTNTQIENLFNGLKVYGSYPDGTIYMCK
jgi:hypothetical protein